MDDELLGVQSLSIEEKRNKLSLNYETIQVLKDRLEESKAQQKVGMTRAAYIKMIFDVTHKVTKQSDEITDVISEVRQLQRDISNLSGRLERSFTLVENTILKDAMNDGWSRDCYRLLKTMHENCDQLIQAVQDTGDINREIRQLEDQVGQARFSHQASSDS